jgi:hypothetical protein
MKKNLSNSQKIVANDTNCSYKINKFLGRHIISTFSVACRSCHYLYDNNTQAKYIKLA